MDREGVIAALFAAASEGFIDELYYTIGQANELNLKMNDLRNKSGSTLLHAACMRDKENSLTVVKTLLQNGLLPHVKDGYGFTVIIYMTRTRKYNAKVAEQLGVSLNDVDNEGRTALMFAASGAGLFGRRSGNITIASHLLSLGAKLFVRDTSGRTALGHAVYANDTQKNQEMIDFLQHKMISQTAISDFKSRNNYGFDKNGNLEVSSKL